MGVSADSGLDLHAILSGGPQLARRLEDFQLAAAAYKKQLDELNLGKDAVAYHEEASRTLENAKRQRDADMANHANAMAAARAELEGLQGQASDLRSANQKAQAQIQANISASDISRKEADTAMLDANSKASKIMADAQSKADNILATAQAKADKLLARADEKHEKAKEALTAAQKAETKYNNALSIIRSAIPS